MKKQEKRAPVERRGEDMSIPNSLFEDASRMTFIDSTITFVAGDSRNIEGNVTMDVNVVIVLVCLGVTVIAFVFGFWMLGSR
ncbi:hypothetical protein K435DRAFT_863164 [Dendrothele bispora CBS 962.96]|uniref:Uncharacterized protein n=1 Tax=Dendrothele bispora (strain CBS 962.96) TaxID=1314807 RepID=A0A4S8LS43_DENBC|nr:hypothetical protein K435DRAFT_863164 [Dendrothele bispora CBS 962.96]